jgi:hypothetical protein
MATGFQVRLWRNLFSPEKTGYAPEHRYTNQELYDLFDPSSDDSPYVYDSFTWDACADDMGVDIRHFDV